jgi:hypothetical protein
MDDIAFLDWLFHLEIIISGVSMSFNGLIAHFSLALNNIQLFRWTKAYPSIYLKCILFAPKF